MSLGLSFSEHSLVLRARVFLFTIFISKILFYSVFDYSTLYAHDLKNHHSVEGQTDADLEALKNEYSELVLSFAKMFKARGLVPSLGNVVHGTSLESIEMPAIYALHFEQQKIISRFNNSHQPSCSHGCSHHDHDSKMTWWQSTKEFLQKRSVLLFTFLRNPLKFFSESYQSFEVWRKQDPHASRLDPQHFETSLGIYLAKIIQQKALNTYRHLELQSVHVVYSHDRSIATYIVVSQAIWEAIETVISNMILPGSNIHVACTIFNGALLATAFPMDCVQKLSSNYTFREAAWKRLTKAFYIYAESHMLKRYASRHYRMQSMDNFIPISSKDLLVSSSGNSIIKYDFEKFISHSTSKSAKLLFVNNLISLMGAMIKQSGSFLEPIEHNHLLEHSKLRSLHALSGRLKYIQLSFQTHLEYLAYSESSALKDLSSELYLSWMQEFSDFVHMEYNLLKDIIENKSEPNFEENFKVLWKATDDMLRGLQKLRSPAFEVKDSQCSSVMIE